MSNSMTMKTSYIARLSYIWHLWHTPTMYCFVVLQPTMITMFTHVLCWFQPGHLNTCWPLNLLAYRIMVCITVIPLCTEHRPAIQVAVAWLIPLKDVFFSFRKVYNDSSHCYKEPVSQNQVPLFKIIHLMPLLKIHHKYTYLLTAQCFHHFRSCSRCLLFASTLTVSSCRPMLWIVSND